MICTPIFIYLFIYQKEREKVFNSNSTCPVHLAQHQQLVTVNFYNSTSKLAVTGHCFTIMHQISSLHQGMKPVNLNKSMTSSCLATWEPEISTTILLIWPPPWRDQGGRFHFFFLRERAGRFYLERKLNQQASGDRISDDMKAWKGDVDSTMLD